VWKFTPTAAKEDGFGPLAHLFDPTKITYWIYQHEKATTTERDHLQVYMVTTKKMQLNAIKALVGDPTAHVESRKGTPAQAIAYCSKADTRVAGPWQQGEKPLSTGQGHRSDLEHAMKTVREQHLTELETLERFPEFYARNFPCAQRLLKLFAPQRDPKVPMVVDLYCGAPGSGKSWDALHQLTDEFNRTPFVKVCNCLWFDEYAGHKGVVFDEFTGNTLQFHQLLQYCDRYPVSVQFKGGSTPWLAEHIIITSNKPATWFTKKAEIELDALWRRFRQVVIYRCRGSTYPIANPGPGSEREFRQTVLAKWREFGLDLSESNEQPNTLV